MTILTSIFIILGIIFSILLFLVLLFVIFMLFLAWVIKNALAVELGNYEEWHDPMCDDMVIKKSRKKIKDGKHK